jgi:hypothetical protein
MKTILQIAVLALLTFIGYNVSAINARQEARAVQVETIARTTKAANAAAVVAASPELLAICKKSNIPGLRPMAGCPPFAGMGHE